MKKHLITLGFLFSFFLSSASPVLSEKAKIYLLTCQPGTEVYATFGHSAFFIDDKVRGIDYVFNYGLFSFDEENFLYKFVKGETYYMLGVESYDHFLRTYNRRQMGVYAQELDLTQAEKDKLYIALMTNALPENREYLYNFFYDNCATRLRDMLEQSVDGTIIYSKPSNNEGTTYRDLIELYTGNNTWLKFGIDILVGAPADKPISDYDKMFLPYFLMNEYAHSVIDRDGEAKALVSSSAQIIPNFARDTSKNIFYPFVVMCLLLIAAIVISIYDMRKRKQSIWFDFILFFAAGVIGIIVTFVSFFSIHPAVLPNYNIFWLHPLHLIFAVLLLVKSWRPTLYYYHYFNLLMLVSALILSLFAQTFNPAFYPLMAVFALRSGTAGYIYNRYFFKQ